MGYESFAASFLLLKISGRQEMLKPFPNIKFFGTFSPTISIHSAKVLRGTDGEVTEVDIPVFYVFVLI